MNSKVGNFKSESLAHEKVKLPIDRLHPPKEPEVSPTIVGPNYQHAKPG